MITLQTYCLEPFIAANAKARPFSTEWLRKEICKKVKDKLKILIANGADPSLFYNHVPETENNRIGYPLIIYHYFNGIFYITGIDNGAYSLDIFAKLYEEPFSMDSILFQIFKGKNFGCEFDLCSTAEPRLYALIGWLPVHHKSAKAFSQKDMAAKVDELNSKLGKHITGELGKYLGVGFENLFTAITDITKVYPDPVIYKRYEYPAFDIRFTANVSLPRYITLGNIQSLGFGRVEPV